MHRGRTAAERLDALSTDEREIVRQCLNAAVIGPFFPDWEFDTLFGVRRAEVADVVRSWPHLPVDEEVLELSINNTFANLLRYPHEERDAWSHLIQATRAEVERVYYKWRGDRPVVP
jgi:hypothetical protein